MNDKNAPFDPMTPTDVGWVAMHEMYTGMRNAASSMLEAAAIIGATIAQQGNPEAAGS